MKRKVLIIRFSSLGDIFHCMEVPAALKRQWQNAEVHWVVRQDFAHLVQSFPLIDRVWVLDRKQGLAGLRALGRELKKENFTHIYDAHSNLRSHLLSWQLVSTLRKQDGIKNPYFQRRPKERWKRFLLFRLRKNLFPWPFRSAESFLRPLTPWGIRLQGIEGHHLQFDPPSTNLQSLESKIRNSLILAPSAAWNLKRWPIEHWKQLIQIMNQENFVLLGGPEDTFCQEIAQSAPDRVTNLAGQLSWMESAQVVDWGKATISGDTGVMHISDFLGKKTLALIGPSAFGYPSRPQSQVIETELKCKPCSKDGRGRCVNPIYKRCMIDIQPEKVAEDTQTLLQSSRSKN